jgi:ectoine hydroxylase-related dioxygenase (phytanoyl-CoA dioxygenase family)
MEIGDWKATYGLNESFRAMREMGLESNLAELDAFGFTVIEDAAPSELVERLLAAVMATTADREEMALEVVDGKATQQGMKYQNHLLIKDRAFEQALMLEKPLAVVKYLAGESCIFSTMGSHVRGDGGDELALHADVGGWMPQPYPLCPMFVNCTLALTDYTRDGGALAVVPGSHRKCRSPEASEMGVENNKLACPVEVPAGSAIIWHGNLWHGGYVRKDPGFRVNLAMVFLRAGLMPQENYQGLIPQETFDRNDERFAQLLGRDVAWNFGEEGPDYVKLAKQGKSTRNWYS